MKVEVVQLWEQNQCSKIKILELPEFGKEQDQFDTFSIDW